MSDLLAVERPEQLLPLLLERWRASWDPRVAELIDETGRCLDPLDFPRGGTHRALAEALITASADPLRCSAACAELLVFATTLRATKGFTALRPVVEAWAAHEPDPRLGRALYAVLAAHADLLPRPLQLDLMRALWPHFDAGLEVVPEKFPLIPSMRTELARARKERPTTTGLPAPLLEALTARVKGWPRLTRTAPARDDAAREAELLAQIIAAPDDDGVRHVYADWLTERGRPMGELIELELAPRGANGPAARARKTALLKELRQEISAQFGGTLHLPSAKRSRGFVSEATLGQTGHPLVALLEQLDFSQVTAIAPGSRFDQLRRARGLTLAQLADVLPSAPRLEDVEVRVHLNFLVQAETAALLARLPRAVRRVQCLFLGNDASMLRALWASRLLTGAEEVLLGAVDGDVLFELLARAPATLQRLTFLDGAAMCWSLSRSGPRFDVVHGVFLDGLKTVRDVEGFLFQRSRRFTGATKVTFELGRGRLDVVKAGLAAAGSFGGAAVTLLEPPSPAETFELLASLARRA